jgi:hypothetical protein
MFEPFDKSRATTFCAVALVHKTRVVNDLVGKRDLAS